MNQVVDSGSTELQEYSVDAVLLQQTLVLHEQLQEQLRDQAAELQQPDTAADTELDTADCCLIETAAERHQLLHTTGASLDGECAQQQRQLEHAAPEQLQDTEGAADLNRQQRQFSVSQASGLQQRVVQAQLAVLSTTE